MDRVLVLYIHIPIIFSTAIQADAVIYIFMFNYIDFDSIIDFSGACMCSFSSCFFIVLFCLWHLIFFLVFEFI